MEDLNDVSHILVLEHLVGDGRGRNAAGDEGDGVGVLGEDDGHELDLVEGSINLGLHF